MRSLVVSWALFGLAVTAAPLHADAPPPKLDRAALAADIDVLEQAYTELHPGLYRYQTPEQAQAHFAALRQALDHEGVTLPQAYLAFSRFAATVRCGHTYANFYNQPKALRQALFENPNRLPFYFRWLDSRMWVTRDLTADHALPAGTEVLAVDGLPVARVLAGLLPYARADGSNDAKRQALMQVQGEDKYETFDIFLPLVFPQTDVPVHRLRVRLPGSRTVRTRDVPSQSYAARLAARPEAPDDETHGWRFSLDDPRYALLRMPDWALYDSRWDWKGFIETSFAQLAAAPRPALVIDLRGNEGGLDVGDEILPHLVEQPVEVAEPPRLVRYRQVPVALAPVLDTWDDSFKDWGDAAQPFDARYFKLVRDADEARDRRRIELRAPLFRGRVFVLIGASNSSATFQFAELLQQTHRATLVGTPTGGNRRGINGGAFFFLRLPNSRIELDLPLIARFPPGDPPDAGLLPDLPVATTARDLELGRDPELAAVRRLLEAAPVATQSPARVGGSPAAAQSSLR